MVAEATTAEQVQIAKLFKGSSNEIKQDEQFFPTARASNQGELVQKGRAGSTDK